MNADQYARFVAKIDFEERDEDFGECWIWTGARTNKGYGKLGSNGKTLLAHRVAYEHFVGSINSDREIDHLCRNKACVHPRHLRAATHSENMAVAFVTESGAARRVAAVKGKKQSPEHIERRTAKLRGRQLPDCTRKKMSIAARIRGPISEETRQKISEAGRRRWTNHARQVCAHGHAMVGDNVVVGITKEGWQKYGCRQCQREATKRYLARKRAQVA